MKKLSLLILLCLFTAIVFAQQTEKRCFTMERYNSALYQNQEPIQNLRVPGGSYSNTTGYGAGCTNDCDLSTRMPVPGCNTPSVYQIPIVYRVGTGTGCPQNGNSGPGPIPTQAELDAMLGITNEYFACVGLPVELIKCTSYDTGNLSPSAVVQGDNSTVFEPVDCNFNTAALTDIPNVMNVYVFQDTGNGTGCNGFAYLPGGLDQVAMSTACYNGVTDDYTCGDTGVGVSQVFIHEVGHFLGLFHTHDTDSNSQYGGACDDPSIATDDCSSGDFISDTDEDPDYSGGEICGITNCDTGSPSSNCAFNNAASANCSVYGTPNTIDNIMSYNIFQGCIISLTDCQKAKMIDALTCARTNLVCCDPVITDNADATNYMTESIQYVCAGDAPSAFTVDNPAGAAPALDAGCIAWYDAMGNQLGAGTSFTPPTSGTGAFDNNTPGTYVYFFDDDANEYTTTDCDDQVLKQVTVIVLGNAGTGDSGGVSTTISDCTAPVVLPIDAVGEALGSDANAIGWYFSTSDPTTTLTTDAAITGAISGAAAGTPTAPADGVIFQSNTNDPETALSALTIDCDALGDGTYYMTPFIAYGQAPVICSQTSPTSAGADYGDPFGGAGILFDAVGPLSCDGMGLPNKTWEICVDITSAGTNMIVFSVNDPASCGAIGFPGPTANCPTFPCEFCFQQSDFPAGFDPEVDDYCLAAADGTLTNSQGDILYTATTTITYTGDDALTIWDANGTPSIQASNGAESCFWGTPYAVTCMCSAACTIENITSTDAVCNGNDAEYTICFDVTDGSGDYNIVDTNNANAVLFSATGLATTTDPDVLGDEVCITATIVGPTAATVLNVDVVDNTDALCIGGDPAGVAVPVCPSVTCTATASITATNPTTACAADGMVNICIDVDSGDPTEVTINVDGVMATGAVAATQVCVALTLDDNMSCAPTTQNYMVGALCSDNSVLVATSMQSITVYPQALTLNQTDDGTTCGTPSIQLVAMDNTVCATQTKAAICADNNDSFDYDFATDAVDDGYDGTWIANAPTACMPAATGTINCAGCTALACTISNVAIGTAPACAGTSATYQICFDVVDGSGAYDLVDTDNANAIIMPITGQATNTDPITAGDEICITATVPNSTGSTLNVDILDNADNTCIGGTPLSVVIPDCSGPTTTTIDISDPCSCDAGIVACAAPAYPYTTANPPGNIDVDGDGFILGNGIDLVADVIEIIVNPVIPGETISVTAVGNALSCDGTPIAVGAPMTQTTAGSGIYQLVVYYPGDGSGFGTMSFEGDMGTASISIANPSAQYEACICAPCRPTCAEAGQFPRN